VAPAQLGLRHVPPVAWSVHACHRCCWSPVGR
jgi:hypothetical protein